MTNTAGRLDKEGTPFQLIRLNVQASSASPQGSLAAAAQELQKNNQATPATPGADAASTDNEGDLTVNPFRHEILVKNAAEREARNMLPTAAPVADGTSSGKGIPQNVASAEQDPMTAAKGTGTAENIVLQGEEKAKNAPIVSGKDSTHWVPFAGATSPQLAPESGTTLKGVFIPMDRVISEAGKILENGAGKVQMTLQPPNLGTINMEVVVRSNRVDLVLTANHADVQQILQANADQLKNALTNQGFQIDQMSVLLKRESFGFNLGGHSLWQDGTGRKPNQGSGSTGSDVISVPEAEKITPRWDYGNGAISIFV
jgi:flagellar hook-length control protein FliK